MRPRGRREKMQAADALCHCGSHDVRFREWSPHKLDHRPIFYCGSCGAEWTAGTLGKPYIDFVDAPGPQPPAEEWKPGANPHWDHMANIGEKNRRKRDAAAKRRAALKRK